ncbi:MAG: hypothetical protein ACD_20C00186G0005 [uncultured bacterium]|nr:MAG: hypothetical protein ACD_20C00186G0005 [uncultured bacterium]
MKKEEDNLIKKLDKNEIKFIENYKSASPLLIPAPKIDSSKKQKEKIDKANISEVEEATNENKHKFYLKRAVASLNQALVMNIAQQGVSASDCSECNGNKAALAKLFINNLNVIDQNLSDSNPHFSVSNGQDQSTRFTIERSTGSCGSNNSVDPSKANCVILVDVNGNVGPNLDATGNNKSNYRYYDRYRLIVKSSTVVPAKDSGNDIAVHAMVN